MLSTRSTETFFTSAGPLSVVGDVRNLSKEKTICVVGGRAASKAGRTMAHGLAAGLARDGWVVISGGALGIDSAAHAGALSAGGATVAVVAGGALSPYPERNEPLFAAIVARGGAVASPFGDTSPIRRWHFVRRNQVMALLSGAVVVVEGLGRSGALHTARAAAALGRRVAAVPGSAATDGLIARGAAPVRSLAELVDALAGRPRALEAEAPAAGSEAARALAVLEPRRPLAAAEVAEIGGMTLREAQRGLISLELSGWVIPAPGGRFRRAGVGDTGGAGRSLCG